MITLALETSTREGGVALFENGEVAFTETFTADRSHSSELFSVIEKALGAHALPGRIVVGLGPGSYAGVRIAIAAAIGISVATGAKLVGVPSVAALEDGEYVAIGDARRGGYGFSQVRDGAVVVGPMVLTSDELKERLAGVKLPVLSSEDLRFPGVDLRFPSVDRLGRLGIAEIGITARGALEPIYLREPHITVPRPT